MALLKPRRWLGYRIEINDLLTDSEVILDRFEESEIPLDDCFGSSSDPPERPRSTILVFGPGTEPARLAELLDLLEGCSIHYVQAETGSCMRKVIFLGGYNFDSEPVAPAADPLLRALRAAGSSEEMTEIVLGASSVTALTVRS